VVALAAAVVILATTGSDEPSPITQDDPTARSESQPQGSGASDAALSEPEACELEVFGVPTELELRSSRQDCESASRLIDAFQRKGNVIGPARVGGWTCEGQPTASWPLVVFCARPGEMFLAEGTGRGPHGAMPGLQIASKGTQRTCGDLAESGAGVYDVVATGVTCIQALHIAHVWDLACPGDLRGPCYIIHGGRCEETPVSYELVGINCEFPRKRFVQFQWGA